MPVEYHAPGVYIEEFERGTRPIQGVGTAVAAFVGFTARAPDNRPHLVTSWSGFTTLFGGFLPDAYLAHAVRGYFENGGKQCYVVSVSAAEIANGPSANGAQRAIAAAASIPARSPALGTSLQVEAIGEGDSGEGIQVEIGPATGDGANEEQFRLVVRKGDKEEVFDQLTLSRGRGSRNAEAVVNRESVLVRLRIVAQDAVSSLERLPEVGLHALRPADTQTGTLPARIKPAELTGNAEEREGVLGLEAIDEVTILCVPDLMSPRVAGEDAATRIKMIQLGMINHCEAMGERMAILDAPPNLTVQEIKEWRTGGAGYDSKFAALYYPWIKVANPIPKEQRSDPDEDLIDVPPCGHIAGVYSRVDSERGVHKAPANEVVRGAIDLARQITRNEQELLNPIGINCIRAFPNMGIRVWGARTLASDPAWRYINVRRLFNFIEESIEESTQWVVFEPNDEDLWERVKRDITAFLTRVWRSGALFGATAEEAFYVKCDRETNPPEVRDAGQLIVEIGLAPVKPAEFVVFRFTQKTLES